ncbi:MAG: glutathione S-transferase [Myxococcales bacterium]|nr:glutathione S-transferase [Myxococcales bacterium]
MITLHYLTDSRAHRILWMLEELGLEYEIEVHRRNAQNLAPDSLRAVHPLGKSPVLVDDGVTLAESGAIVEHLAETYAPAMRPTEGEAAREHRYWLHFAEGSLQPALVMKHVFNLARARVPRLLRPVLTLVPRMIERAYLDATLDGLIRFVDDHLDGREFFVGDALSCADVMMIFPLEASASRHSGGASNIERYVRGVHARPAYQASLKRAGVPYAYA